MDDIYFNIRQADIDEAESIVSCLKEVYSANYARRDMYSVSEISKMMLRGELVIFISTTASGELAGMIGALKTGYFNRAYELVMYQVMKQYRNSHVGISLIRHSIEFLRNSDYSVGYAHTVTTVSVGQSHAQKGGMLCTGFLFGIRDNGLYPMGDTKSTKRSSCVHALKVNARDSGIMYIPEKLSNITRQIYDSLGVSYRVVTKPVHTTGSSCISHEFDGVHSVLYVYITIPRADAAERIWELVHRYCTTSVCTVTVFLNIRDAGAPDGLISLSRNGYRFSGFKPLYYDCEFVILSNPLKTRQDESEMVLTKEATSLLREVNAVEIQ